jgi:hypothetical protein
MGAVDSSFNPLEALASQYKQGWKTSEFWVALAAGAAQAAIVAFDPSKPLSAQVQNMTWVAIAYILGRSGLKVARAASSAKVVATATQAGINVSAATAASSSPASPAPVTGNGTSEWIILMRNLVDLRDRGEISPEQFERARLRLEG